MELLSAANVPPEQELAELKKLLECRERELEYSGNALRSILGAAAIPLALFDSSLRVTHHTPEAMICFNMSAALTGMPLADVSASLHYPQMAADARTALAQQRIIERGVTHADGREFLARWSPVLPLDGTSGGVVLALIDLTEVRRATRDLTNSREHLRMIIGNIPDYAIFCADPERKITRWNIGAERIFGFSENEILGRAADVIFTPEDRAAHVPEKELETAPREDPALDERWYLRRDGSRFRACGRMIAVHNPSGETVGLVGILRDQSEDRKAAENAAAAKDDFLAALSHELRTPLNPALMTIAALESDMSLPESARFSLASARRNIELEAGLIDDVLDATRITRGMISFSPAPCDLHALLARASEIALSDRQRGAEALNLDCGAEEHWVNGEAARLQQILWNLLRNAFKFAESGGTISVRTYNPTADRIVLAVTDSCGALPSDSFGSVSGPSEQTSGSGRQRFGGLSLGLTISKALAELHGGTLRASSNGVGKGTTFLLELPANPAGQLLSETSMPENPVPGPPLRLLLVEDHETSLKALIWHLERDGHTVFPAGSGREALALAEREDCDLIISDIGLPDISGLEVMRQIRRLHGWPGIALSGYGMPGDISASKAAGFSLHLLKPVKLAELRGALKKFGKPGTREWMARWRNLDQKR